MQAQHIRPFGLSRPCVRPLVPCYTGSGIKRCSRAITVVVRANAKADDVLAKARLTYEKGDRLQAMKLYEDVLNEEPSPQQKQAALYGVMAVHASFGDVELAQMTLREAIRNGLKYEKAIENPDYVRVVTSPQISIQLRRFAQQLAIAMANRPPTERPYGSSAAANRRPKGGMDARDLDSILGSAGGDQAEVDTSIGGIIRRVVLVVLVGVALGVGLWFLGLEYLFPQTG